MRRDEIKSIKREKIEKKKKQEKTAQIAPLFFRLVPRRVWIPMNLLRDVPLDDRERAPKSIWNKQITIRVMRICVDRRSLSHRRQFKIERRVAGKGVLERKNFSRRPESQ